MATGKNLPVDMFCTGKDRASHLAGILHMCLALWKIASLIGFFSGFFFNNTKPVTMQATLYMKNVKKNIKISGIPVSSLMLWAQMINLKRLWQQ